MLKSIDILISLSVVMLVASMAVTVLVGFYTHLANTRGRNLQQGIGDLLRLINPDFVRAEVDKISEAILKHPLIRDGENRMGTVIHREELTTLLLSLASGQGPQKLEQPLEDKLKLTLANLGIDDPEEKLKNIRSLAVQLEKSSPQLSNTARANLAILHEADSHFVAKLNNWFDQTMDRVSHRFTLSTRTITMLCGLFLAVTLQLDTIELVNRLSVDEALRESLVTQAKTLQAQTNPNVPQSNEFYAFLSNSGVIPLPKYPQDFGKLLELRHLTGILFTTLLLSLGAPFWYGALQNLLQLRSKIAQTDDDERQERQSTQGAIQTPVGPGAADPGVLAGERGDLAAVG